MNAVKGKGWLWAWGLLFPLPTTAFVVACAAFVGTSFHSPQAGGTIGLGLFALVAGKAWRDGPRFFTAFMCGISAVVIGTYALVLYALAHMGPMG